MPRCTCPEAISGVTDSPCPAHGGKPKRHKATHPRAAMADTPEEVVFDVFASSDIERAKRIIVAATTAAEARGFAKGLRMAAQHVESHIGNGWEGPPDLPLKAAVRGILSLAPPEVAAAEPKP